MKNFFRKKINENMVELSYVDDYLPNVDLKNKEQISNDVIPLELLNDIQIAAERAGVTITIMFAKSNHGKNTKSGTRSRHSLSRALDLSMINGKPIDKKTESITDKFVSELEKLGYYRNVEGPNPKSVLWKLKDGSHYDHVHISNMLGIENVVSYQNKSDKKNNKKGVSNLVTASSSMIEKLIELLKSKNIKKEDISPYTSKPKVSKEFTIKLDSNLDSKFRNVVGDDYGDFISDVKSIGLDPNIAIRQLYVESAGFSHKVIICDKKSIAGAMGLAQFMPGTWTRYGEGSPCNVSDALKAYVKFMGVLMDRFPGRPDLAVASYNSGPNYNAYKHALNNDLDMETIQSKIPKETFNYYKKIFQV